MKGLFEILRSYFLFNYRNLNRPQKRRRFYVRWFLYAFFDFYVICGMITKTIFLGLKSMWLSSPIVMFHRRVSLLKSVLIFLLIAWNLIIDQKWCDCHDVTQFILSSDSSLLMQIDHATIAQQRNIVYFRKEIVGISMLICGNVQGSWRRMAIRKTSSFEFCR